MITVEFSSLPQVMFAHSFEADNYTNHIKKQTNRIELTYIRNGSFTSSTTEEEVVFSSGDLHLNLFDTNRTINAEEYHCHHTVSARIDMHLSSNMLQGLCLPLKTPASLVPNDVYRIIDDMIHLANEQPIDCSRSRAEFMTLLYLVDFCNRKAVNNHMSPSDYYITKAQEYISNHIHETITQRSVADYLGISSGYLCEIFKDAQHEPLMHYVNSIKLRNIEALLVNEDIKLKDACMLFGYTDPNYVSRLYKQYFGHNITSNL